ncbi:MAG: type II CAAX endopeptidase family protein [Candidatus Acidiferrales bacterium]
MSFLLAAKRLGAFIRTLLPADPSSWLLLFGATLFFIAHSLRWWPRSGSYSYRPLLWAGCTYLISLPIFAAGVVAFYLGLVGSKKTARRLFDSVLLPVAIGLLANLVVAFFWFRDIGEPAYFVTQLHGTAHLWQPHVLLSLTKNLHTGFQLTSIGFILVAVLCILCSWGLATLPMHLAAPLSRVSSSEDEHRRTMLFVWLMIGMAFLAWLPVGALALLGNSIFPHVTWPYAAWTFWVGGLIDAALLLGFVVFAVGKSDRKLVPAMLRIPDAQYMAIPLLIPTVIAYIGPLASYAYARVLWSTHGWGTQISPLPRNFLGLPAVSSAWYFLPALVEEIAWRGYLQPRFIRRYGLVRGIFLVGVVWGAFHFFWDFNSSMTAREVGIKLIVRLAGTISLSYVLAWVTIRSGSILPAAAAHGTYNIFITGRSLPLHDPPWLSILLWTVGGIALFRYFPSSPNGVDESDMPSASEAEPTEV